VPCEAAPPSPKSVACSGGDLAHNPPCWVPSRPNTRFPGAPQLFPTPTPRQLLCTAGALRGGSARAAAARKARRGRRRLGCAGRSRARIREPGEGGGRGSASFASGANRRGLGAALARPHVPTPREPRLATWEAARVTPTCIS
jgi:hypothetical protein